MKRKTAELQGTWLDLAVAKALGRRTERHPSAPGWWLVLNEQREWDTIMDEAPDPVDPKVWSPSAKWEHGGPLIERERIATLMLMESWCAWMPGPGNPRYSFYNPYGEFFDLTSRGATGRGPSPLIAAMRAYVAAKLGEEVELP